MALDVGEKRVGVAVSDPLGYSAQPLTVLPRRPHGEFLNSLAALAQEYEVELMLLGLPRRTTGTCAAHQRELTEAIKRARQIALLPYVAE